MGIKTDIRVLGGCVLIVLCGERDIAAIGKNHSIFLQGASHDPGGWRKLRHVVRRLEAETDADGRSEGRTLGCAGMRGRMHENVGTDAGIRKDESNGMVDAARRQFVCIEEKRRNGEACGISAGALVSAPGRWINSVEIPHGKHGRADGPLGVVGGKGFVKFAFGAIRHDQEAVASLATISVLTFEASVCREGDGG